MAKSTRFTTTVSTRNLISSNGFDGFYLDGRISGPRDSRMGETTLDREDRGFFYAIYTNTGSDIKQAAFKNKKHLDKIFEDMKLENKYNIDYEINELADCAVNIASRQRLGNENNNYFAGLIVKDGELAAITSGSVCAYLYRNDILYPLTYDDFPIQDVDLNGNKIPNLDLYCAGVAGTIRYSNIAQLQPDDCFILTNRVVMESIGHLGMLRLLEEAYDQQDAACKVYDFMAEHNPNATVQFMIGFVESLNTLDKAALKSLTGRMDWTQKTLNSIGGLSALSEATQLNASLHTQDATKFRQNDLENNQPNYQEYKPYTPSTESTIPSKEVKQPSINAPQFSSEVDLGESREPNTAEVRSANLSSSSEHNYQEMTNYNQQFVKQNKPQMPVEPPRATFNQINAVSPLSQDTQIVQARSSSIPVSGVAMPNHNTFVNNGQYKQDEKILRGVSESGITIFQKIIIGILLTLILSLTAFIGYLVYQTYFNNEDTNSDNEIVDVQDENNELIDNGDNKLDIITETEAEIKKKQEEERKRLEAEQKQKEEEQKKLEEEKKKAEEEKRRLEEEARKKYVVKAGDTLWSIAFRNRGNTDVNEYLSQLINNNKDVLPNGQNSFIQEGMELKLP